MVQVGGNKSILFWFYIIILFSCKNESSNLFENKKEYNLKVGETFKIYFKLNSSFKYCIFNLNELSNIELVSERSLRIAPLDCDGCNEVYELEFLAKSKGRDVLKHSVIPVVKNCGDNLNSHDIDKIIIHVSN